MAGSDIDRHSLTYARKNVEANGLGKRIRLAQTTAEGPLIPLDTMPMDELDFVMTNPPFYDSTEDMQNSYTNKSIPPSAVCTGSSNEMICPSGDLGFVTRILEESLVVREKVQWYTAMLGKMTSLQQIVAKLKEKGLTNFAVTSLTAGFRTKRWAVAWSFQGYRPRNDVARHGELVLGVLPQPTAQTIEVPLKDASLIGRVVDETMKELDVRWTWRAASSVGVAEARENVWSRHARRKKKIAAMGGKEGQVPEVKMNESSEDPDEEEVGLAVEIACKDEKVEVRWLRGEDYVLFESFCGMLKRALTR